MPEPNNNPATQGQGANNPNPPVNNTNANDNGGPKNVSREDFNGLVNTVNGIGDLVRQALGQNGNNNNGQSNNSNNSNNEPSNNNNNNNQNNNGETSIEDDPKFKELSEKYNGIKKQLDDSQAKELQNHLTDVAKEQAQTHGINIDGIMDQILLGGDEATVKQNVDNIAQSIKDNAKQSTNKGFNINSDDVGNKESIMSNLYARHGLNRKK